LIRIRFCATTTAVFVASPLVLSLPRRVYRVYRVIRRALCATACSSFRQPPRGFKSTLNRGNSMLNRAFEPNAIVTRGTFDPLSDFTSTALDRDSESRRRYVGEERTLRRWRSDRKSRNSRFSKEHLRPDVHRSFPDILGGAAESGRRAILIRSWKRSHRLIDFSDLDRPPPCNAKLKPRRHASEPRSWKVTGRFGRQARNAFT